VFGGLGLVPSGRHAHVMEERITWNYTTWLNIVFLVLAFALLVRFLRTGGRQMMAMMNGSPDDSTSQDHHQQAPPAGAEPHLNDSDVTQSRDRGNEQ